LLPEPPFDGLDKTKTIPHWVKFEKFIKYHQKRFDSLKEKEDIMAHFRLVLSNPALEWFDSLPNRDDMTLEELGQAFVRQYSKWGSNPSDYIRAWNDLKLNLATDTWETWLVNFKSLAKLCSYDDVAMRYKLLSLLPATLRLHVQNITDFKEFCKFVKDAIPTARELSAPVVAPDPAAVTPAALTHSPFSGTPSYPFAYSDLLPSPRTPTYPGPSPEVIQAYQAYAMAPVPTATDGRPPPPSYRPSQWPPAACQPSGAPPLVSPVAAPQGSREGTPAGSQSIDTRVDQLTGLVQMLIKEHRNAVKQSRTSYDRGFNNNNRGGYNNGNWNNNRGGRGYDNNNRTYGYDNRNYDGNRNRQGNDNGWRGGDGNRRNGDNRQFRNGGRNGWQDNRDNRQGNNDGGHARPNSSKPPENPLDNRNNRPPQNNYHFYECYDGEPSFVDHNRQDLYQ
jgi:hypothetical protein